MKGNLRIQLMNEMKIQCKNSRGIVLIYFLVIEKKKLADVILVDICFHELLIFLLLVFGLKEKEVYFLFTYQKKNTKFAK